uniref:Uncharacterized protein n=1 Tax=Glossina austeni TaxID=7395 RepID=A0A1A9UD63_GLOAU
MKTVILLYVVISMLSVFHVSFQCISLIVSLTKNDDKNSWQTSEIGLRNGKENEEEKEPRGKQRACRSDVGFCSFSCEQKCNKLIGEIIGNGEHCREQERDTGVST